MFISISSRARVPMSLWAILLFLSLAAMAKAQSGSENPSLFVNLFGQGNAAVNGTQAVKDNSCVPTAVANGLDYLNNYIESLGQPSPFSFSPLDYSDVNALQSAMGTTAGGTSLTNLTNGLANYLSPGGWNPAPTVAISGQTSPNVPAGWGFQAGSSSHNPTALFLANALNANDGVEITLQWGSYDVSNVWHAAGGGHEVTLGQIDLAGGTIGFIDPWGSSTTTHASTTGGIIVDGEVSVVTDATDGTHYLYVTYPNQIGAGGNDPGDTSGTTVGFTGGETARIVADTVESVPEPGSMALAVFGGVGLLVRWRREGQK